MGIHEVHVHRAATNRDTNKNTKEQPFLNNEVALVEENNVQLGEELCKELVRCTYVGSATSETHRQHLRLSGCKNNPIG